MKQGVIKFDIEDLSKEELIEMFSELPVQTLAKWMIYYIDQEKYLVCAVIRDLLDAQTV